MRKVGGRERTRRSENEGKEEEKKMRDGLL